jgi:hypothetical protein
MYGQGPRKNIEIANSITPEYIIFKKFFLESGMKLSANEIAI